MGVIIALAALGGDWLDGYYKTSKPVFTIVLSLLGVACGLYILFKEVKQLNKDDDHPKK